MKSEIILESAYITRNTPIPPPTSMPTGPLKLSIQPDTGSQIDDITIDGLMIMQGNDSE